MGIVLPALGAAFAAFVVWLTVRIVNRRERWAKWTAVVVVAMLPITYGAAYLNMVTPKGFIAFSGGPQWTEPRYSNDEFEDRWQRFFRIANWIDRQIRPDVWAGYP